MVAKKTLEHLETREYEIVTRYTKDSNLKELKDKLVTSTWDLLEIDAINHVVQSHIFIMSVEVELCENKL